MDERLTELTDWAREILARGDITVRPASADASFRRYFRVTSRRETWIVMDAPPGRENLQPYVRIARRWLELGLNVPEILAIDPARGFLLLSDLGPVTYLSTLSEHTVERLYGDALGALVILQTGTELDRDFLPPYDETLLRRELELFREWYIDRHLGRTLSEAQHEMLDEVFASLIRSAQQQPQVWVHRDYHSRNLMHTPYNNPGILDFQDAVVGPVSYDLVSLLRDCYITWPGARVRDWASRFCRLALQSGIPIADDERQFLEWFDRMGVQRHIKVLGIFARLFHRDGKADYLADLPRVWAYLVEVCGHYADLMPLRALLIDAPPQRRR